MKKIVSRVIVIILALSLSLSIGACGKEKIINDGKTINVRSLKAGYGDEHFRALATKFEEMYAEEGYKINFVQSDSTIQGGVVYNEMLLGKKNKIDLYLASNVSPYSIVSKSEEEGKEVVAEDISSIFNEKPISADKTEENITIGEKLKDGYAEHIRYNAPNDENDGKYYVFPLVSSPGSFVANQNVMKKYSIETPRTTKELVTAFNKIKAGGDSAVGWGGLDAASYWFVVEDVWMAQYGGISEYKNFVNLTYSEDIRESRKVYEYEFIPKVLKVMESMLDLTYAQPGAIQMSAMETEHNLMNDKIGFMPIPSWLQNEMSLNYLPQMSNMRMIPTPIISDLGIKLKLDGGTGTNAALCENVLSLVVKLIDERKTNEEIIAEVKKEYSVTLTATEQVEEVRKARGIYYDWGVSDSILISANSKVKDISKLFLRFMASDDASRLLYTFANAISAFNPLDPTLYDDTSEFLKSVANLSTYQYSTRVNRDVGNSYYRQKIALPYVFPQHIDLEKTMASDMKNNTAEKIMAVTKKFLDEEWDEYIDAAGFLKK